MKERRTNYAIIEFILAILLIVVSTTLTILKGIYIANTSVTNLTLITFGIQIGIIPCFIILEYIAIKDFVIMIKSKKNKNKSTKKQPRQ